MKPALDDASTIRAAGVKPGWPADMTLRIVGGEVHLLELLWLRHYAIADARPDLPQANLPAPTHATRCPGFAEEWADAWEHGLEFSRRVQMADPGSFATSPELWTAPRPTLLAERIGIDLAPVGAWKSGLSAGQDPEFAALGAVKEAWRSGMQLIIELPLRGEYFTRLGTDTIVVSDMTRRDPAAYAAALQTL